MDSFLQKGNRKKLSSWPDLVHGRAQWNFNRGHAVHVEAKYFRAGKSDHEVACHLLLVGREVAGFDAHEAALCRLSGRRLYQVATVVISGTALKLGQTNRLIYFTMTINH